MAYFVGRDTREMMFYGEERTDGLLRGARVERIQQILALKNEPWSFETILVLHCGLLDHSHDVREAAMDTLQHFAGRRPVAVPVTPVKLLAYFMHTYTVASQVDLNVVQCLAEMRTDEADEVLSNQMQLGTGSNEQFKRWLETLKRANRQDVLRQIHGEKLSSGRRRMLQGVLDTIE